MDAIRFLGDTLLKEHLIVSGVVIIILAVKKRENCTTHSVMIR